ncbi:hypothetical protein OS493_035954 [Desmophyllum pertusum]|uniref:Uncharacterized protein n=1 Tax=Desmophyllum pertusum TaxID=174260 RepID=A0A9X0CJ78_9CNID|nr:hypothetical protein OS493_035954 [Desmophyllum pertusum]
MASAHVESAESGESGGDKLCEEQRQRVITQKKGGKVEPSDLYKLAQLTTRWAPNKDLPVCLLCQDVSKKPSQLGHIIPYSVLKEAKMEECWDWIRGAVISVKNMGYRAFCPDCEKRFGAGEKFLNPQLFKPFNSNPDNRITVQVQADGFPWLYYSLVSIVWRAMCFIAHNADFLAVLECLRGYLLNWSGPKETEQMNQKTKLFVFAPNTEIENKAEEDAVRVFFYKTFHVRFGGGPTEAARSAWVFCGPLHIYFTYSVDIPKDCELTPKTEEFAIEEKNKRFFPVEMYDEIVKWGRQVLSSSLQLPGAVQSTELDNKSPIEATHLDILPKDVSYNPVNDQFEFNTQIYKQECKPIHHAAFKLVKVSRGRKEKILFIAIRRALKNGGHIAMALSIHGKQLSYLKGFPTDAMKKLVVRVNLDSPPHLDKIVELCNQYGLLE